MRTLFCRLIAPLFSLVAALSCSAAQDEGLPLAPTRELHFSTAEGICIWMSVDVVPDGKTLVFDPLGDLYRLPIAGGKASALTRGIVFDTQPRFSPDGQTIAFVSDRSGIVASRTGVTRNRLMELLLIRWTAALHKAW